MLDEQTIPHAVPSEMGVDPNAILRLLDAVEEKGLGLHGLVLLRHGSIIAEGWWEPYSSGYLHMMFSLSKSFTSIAVGFAVQENLLTVDDRLIDFFPEQSASASSGMEKVLLRHLLTMSTGHREEPDVFIAADGVRAFLSSELSEEPGNLFLYNTAATYMLSAVVQRVTGQQTGEYLRPRLFEPLGITDWWWESCPMGIHRGGYGLNLSTGDIAKFGQFLLQKGCWNGKRLISAAWLEEATAFQIQNKGANDWGQGYGYQFWRCVPQHVFRGDGAFGQLCVVLPDQDMVIAVNAGLDDMQQELDAFWENLLPGVYDRALPADEAAERTLAQRLAQLRFKTPCGTAVSDTAASLSGARYELLQNALCLTAVTLTFGETAEMILEFGNQKRTLPLGCEKWAVSNLKCTADFRAPENLFLTNTIAGAGAWNNGVFHTVLRCVTAPFYVILDIVMEENGVLLDCRVPLSPVGEQSWRITGRRIL